MTRGVPGTHDIDLMLLFFKKIKAKNFREFTLPKFNKAFDDRHKKKYWYKLKSRPDILIFEGWCLGAKPQNFMQLKKSVNLLERSHDQNFVWRKFVNNQLKAKYKKFFKQIDTLLYLKVKNFDLLKKWRLKQEKKLWLKTKNKKNLRIMSQRDLLNFMQTYQRITQQMFKDVPKYASIIMSLNNNHQIQKTKFNQ